MISLEPNQFCSWPRSSIICNAPMPSDSVRKPNQEKGTSLRVGVSRMNTLSPSTVRIPNGRLTKNTQRQL